MKINVKQNEKKEIIIEDNSSISFNVEENASLVLKFIFLSSIKNVTINGQLKKNANLKAVVADFSNGEAKMNAKINLNEEGAKVFTNEIKEVIK